jgi:hypothetical protein
MPAFCRNVSHHPQNTIHNDTYQQVYIVPSPRHNIITLITQKTSNLMQMWRECTNHQSAVMRSPRSVISQAFSMGLLLPGQSLSPNSIREIYLEHIQWWPFLNLYKNNLIVHTMEADSWRRKLEMTIIQRNIFQVVKPHIKKSHMEQTI